MNTTAASNDEHRAEERKEKKEGSVPYAGGSSIQSRSRIPGGGDGSIDGDQNSPRREWSGVAVLLLYELHERAGLIARAEGSEREDKGGFLQNVQRDK
jgi:hypothetical protein